MIIQLRPPGQESILLFPHEQKPSLRASLDQHIAKCTLCTYTDQSIFSTSHLMRTFRPSKLCIGGRNIAKWLVERRVVCAAG
jgi:hypothetical protein